MVMMQQVAQRPHPYKQSNVPKARAFFKDVKHALAATFAAIVLFVEGSRQRKSYENKGYCPKKYGCA